MNWVDFFRGTGTTLLIMAVAGAIAYVGDRVGHQVGRRRFSGSDRATRRRSLQSARGC